MKYKFDTKIESPNFVDWALKVKEQNAQRAKERDQNLMNIMKMLGLVGAAYKGNPDMGKSASEYYNDTWSDYSPEDQVFLANAGFNPSLFKSMNGVNTKGFAEDLWAESPYNYDKSNYQNASNWFDTPLNDEPWSV